MRHVFQWVQRHPGWVIGGAALLTGLLAIPMITMAPTESASTEPGGPVFDARDRIDERFVSSVFPVFFIAEPKGGNIVDADTLRDIFLAEEELRSDSDLAPSLYSYFDVEAGIEVKGTMTLADLTNDALDGALLTAPDDVVEMTASAVIEELGPDSPVLNLSTHSSRNPDGTWDVPGMAWLTLSDNEKLGFGNRSVNLGGGTEAEEYSRDILEVLRTADAVEVYGVAIDVNLTSQEQGALAGPFIGFTVLAVLIIVGVVFRSYWVLATVGVALGALIIWLKGITNLFGLKDDLVLSLIVPIAMISFGVDFAFHSVGRYREERQTGMSASRGFAVGLAAVGSALVLALTSDVVAFLSNVTSGIESIVNFGLGAAIALGAAFLLLGIVTPLIVSLIEGRLGSPPKGRRHMVVGLGGSFLASTMVMASVLLMVFVLPWLGVVLYGVTVLSVLLVPFWVRSRSVEVREPAMVAVPEDRLAGPVGRVVAGMARHPGIVLPIALVGTAVAAFFAFQVPAEFEVEDFFSSSSDFVVGLDLLDEHVGDRGGEPAQIYIEADLSDPTVLAAIQSGINDIVALETDVLARDDDGVWVQGGVLAVIEAVWDNPAAQGLITQETGVTLTDENNDRIPDTAQQLTALYEVTSEIGVPYDLERLALTPDDVATAVDIDSGQDATVFAMGLVNSRSQTSIEEAESDLAPIVESMRSELDTTVQLTGSPFVRQVSLDATRRALAISLPIAVALCLLVAGGFLRSVRYGLASVLPILMTVAWLYGFMDVAGYSINIVTATIAAVSIGIGIDFAIHFISRYREELGRLGNRKAAVQAAGEGTGTALLASAVSSAVGFGILAFAPMPLFAAYGLLTAVMIVMALVSTLGVLPSVLVLITEDSAPQTAAMT